MKEKKKKRKQVMTKTRMLNLGFWKSSQIFQHFTKIIKKCFKEQKIFKLMISIFLTEDGFHLAHVRCLSISSSLFLLITLFIFIRETLWLIGNLIKLDKTFLALIPFLILNNFGFGFRGILLIWFFRRLT